MLNKRMCFYWSNDKMSWLRYMTLFSFRKHNPDWKIELYISKKYTDKQPWVTENKQDFHCYTGGDYFQKIKDLNVDIKEYVLELNGNQEYDKISPSQKSNFFKWEILSKENCFYADMDIIFIKPMEELLTIIEDYDTVIAHHGWFSIGFLASSGTNQFFKNILDECFISFNNQDYQGAGVKIVNKVYSSLDDAINKLPNNKIFNIPMNWFYKLGFTEQEKLFEIDCFDEYKDSYGIHWFAGHPLAQDFNNKMLPTTYLQYNNTITTALKWVLNEHP